MNISIDITREVESIIREKQGDGKGEESGKKISSDLLSTARKVDTTLNGLEHDLDALKMRMHESGLDREFIDIKSELRSRLSSALI
jgi:hypothetical protein